MISGLFIQSRRRERGQGVVGSHMILWGKSLFFSPQRLTKNILKTTACCWPSVFSRFQVRHYYYSMFTVSGVQYSTWKGLHSTAQASPVNRVCSQLRTSWFLQDCECTTINHTQFSSHLFVLQVFFVFFSFFSFLPLKTVMKCGIPLMQGSGKPFLFFFPKLTVNNSNFG